MSVHWEKVLTDPLGLAGYALFLLFGVVAAVMKKRSATHRWVLPAAVSLAALSVVACLLLAYRRQPPPTAAAPPTAASAPSLHIDKVDQHVGAGNAIAGVQGNVTISSGPPPLPATSIKQSGKGNQQTATVVRAPVSQTNTGGCNQQSIGSPGATNNCAPPSRELSEERIGKFAAALEGEPSALRIVTASTADDVNALASTICQAAHAALGSCAGGVGIVVTSSGPIRAKGLQCFLDSARSNDAKRVRDAVAASGLKCEFKEGVYQYGGVGFGVGIPVIVIGSPTP